MFEGLDILIALVLRIIFFLGCDCCNIYSTADNPLLSSQNGSDSVFNQTDEAINSTQDGEGRDVLTDMPPDSSAVNRFDKFLKERKDSELLNLMAIRQGIDDSDIEDTGDIKVGFLIIVLTGIT